MQLLQNPSGAASGTDQVHSSKSSSTSTAHLSSEKLGQWQTSTRILACLLNERMVERKPAPHFSGEKQIGLLLHGKNSSPKSPAVWIGLSRPGMRLTEPASKKSAAFPGDFAPPIAITTFDHAEQNTKLEFAPAQLFDHLRSALDVEPVVDDLWNKICSELTSSAENGRHWIEWYQKQKPLTFKSSMIQWEQALYSGHPMHPMHRAFSAQDPMPKILPENISSLMTHSISLISVPGSDVRISGPLRQILKPLLDQYGLDNHQQGTVIMPCVTMQIPVIKHFHPQMEVLVEDAFKFQTQSSLRTVTIPFFDHDLKFALDVTVGSALRTISARTVSILSELSIILREVLPENLWLMSDAGGVSGSQQSFDDSKHISCVFRENLNRKALENNETLVVTGALQEIPPGSDECNAALLYNLKTEGEKMRWFSEYTEGIINAFVGPVVDHGVAFEAHAQNVLIRMDRATGRINGWATRDLGSIKVHQPTLAKSGYELLGIQKGSLVPTQSEMETWRIIQFCLIENHLNIFIYRLGISRLPAWKMIREKLEAFLESRKHLENIERFREFMFAEEIQLKAFMIMKFAKKAAVYDYVLVPNVLLEGLENKAKDVDGVNGVKTNGVDGTNGVNGVNRHAESEHVNGSGGS